MLLPFVDVHASLAVGQQVDVDRSTGLDDAALRDGLICTQVAPASFERQTPRAYEDA